MSSVPAARPEIRPQYFTDILRNMRKFLAEHPDSTADPIPAKSFDTAASLLNSISKQAILAIGKPDINPGDCGELNIDWLSPSADIHIVVVNQNAYADIYTPQGTRHADNLSDVVTLVNSIAAA